MNEALTQTEATEIAGALARIAELSTKAVIESGDATEKRALESFVATKMNQHAQELLGCWFTVATQYRPLVQGFASLLRNAQGALSAAAAITK